jgi:hypothetical protein
MRFAARARRSRVRLESLTCGNVKSPLPHCQSRALVAGPERNSLRQSKLYCSTNPPAYSARVATVKPRLASPIDAKRPPNGSLLDGYARRPSPKTRPARRADDVPLWVILRRGKNEVNEQPRKLQATAPIMENIRINRRRSLDVTTGPFRINLESYLARKGSQ